MNGESMRFVFALGFGARARGLLGSSHNWGDGEAILVIAPCKSVHTFGMCYPIASPSSTSTGRSCAPNGTWCQDACSCADMRTQPLRDQAQIPRGPQQACICH